MKTTSRKTRNGVVRYLHLAHNRWDPATGRAVPKILYGLGREDRLDRDAVRRLVTSLSKLLDPADALAATVASKLSFLESRPFGGAYVLDQLWQRLGVPAAMTRLHTQGIGHPRDLAVTERTLFALVANRAIAPSSRLTAADWVTRDVHIDGLSAIDDDECYRAMDWLNDVRAQFEAAVLTSVARLLNLSMDQLFYDTTSMYVGRDEADEPVRGDERDGSVPGGRSQDRGDGPRQQVLVGLTVTRDGIPLRVWCWPRNAAGPAPVSQLGEDPGEAARSRLVWVTHRELAAVATCHCPRTGDQHYIIGETLRSGSAEARAALSHLDRQAAGSPAIREVPISEGDRLVICSSPQAAEFDAATRTRLTALLREMISGSDRLAAAKRAELREMISTRPGLNRYLRVTSGGLLRTDAAAIKAEASLDGMYVLRCSDPRLPAEEIAAGYQQFLDVERAWRSLRQGIDLRPVPHRGDEHVRVQVVVCWLALLLIRIIETSTGSAWPAICRDLDRIHIGSFTGPAGPFRQRTELTRSQRDLLAKLGMTLPAQAAEVPPASHRPAKAATRPRNPASAGGSTRLC